MNTAEFLNLCYREIVNYYNDNVDKSVIKRINDEDVFVVWTCKTLQNNKALLSTTVNDGMYYEITHNGNRNEMYFDAYKKWENKCIPLNKEEK